MITLIEKSELNQIIRIVSASVILVSGIIAGFSVDSIFSAGKPIILIMAGIIAFPLWLFSMANSGYLLSKKQVMQMLNGGIQISSREATEIIDFDKIESITLAEGNNMIVLCIISRGQSKSYHLYHKWYLRDLNNQSFLKHNLEKVLSMVNIEELKGRLKIQESLYAYTDTVVA